jgi:protein-disulfide isomerase
MTFKRSTLIFGLAIVCLLILLTFSTFLDVGNSTTANTNQSSAQNRNTNQQRQEDPLVTVVPKDVLAGTPQPLSTDPQIGAANPTVTIVEFGDFECENCATMSPVFAQAVREYPNDVRLVWKDFPLPQKHLFSETAALAARCAQDQDAFWQYHDLLFEQRDTFVLGPWVEIAASLSLDVNTFSACLESKEHTSLIVQGYFIARTFDLEETPAYYVNDTLIVGPKTYDELKVVIEQERSETQ